jgi:hypothetical protein
MLLATLGACCQRLANAVPPAALDSQDAACLQLAVLAAVLLGWSAAEEVLLTPSLLDPPHILSVPHELEQA